LTWGLVRVNFSFPIFSTPKKTNKHQACDPVAHPKTGALGGNRTRDLSLTKGVLCH
jgi:hypothetical protein